MTGTGAAQVEGTHTTWSCRWETTLGPEDHTALASLLAESYRSSTARIVGDRSWVGARPELRVVGYQDGRPVAHAGVIRRLLRVPDQDASVLVGDVGLVAVHPGRQGHGLGVALMTTLAAVLEHLAVPYGFLTCGPDVRPFYERCGWNALTDHVVRSVRIDHVVDQRRNGMLLPVLCSARDWPSGAIERNGQEI